ncbi:hypothetical protein QBC33DRAFT_564433 [Phialemonium atrogriseum]|uniref:Uncharacterized protein n=1 Tax=Phialemonium atrogriseum TaxID=1093897 RepID=A0AAJ0BPH0_9PEZI|nr:uncharacterized protein QBC33DRAFT_564433 [Phialemonium atrogriseum]KAK1761785.1 hypothetical protein QBC33DRAFT_564433 [Phialemonium atrogriseum]
MEHETRLRHRRQMVNLIYAAEEGSDAESDGNETAASVDLIANPLVAVLVAAMLLPHDFIFGKRVTNPNRRGHPSLQTLFDKADLTVLVALHLTGNNWACLQVQVDKKEAHLFASIASDTHSATVRQPTKKFAKTYVKPGSQQWFD